MEHDQLGDDGQADSASAPASPVRVLIIDDSSMIRSLLRHSLWVSNLFEVVGEAVDGRDGIDQAATTQPDIVLLDCTMPVMGGLEAIAHLARCSPRSLIIMMSANDAGSTAAKAMAAGAHSYIEKNQQPDELLRRVTTTWKSWSALGCSAIPGTSGGVSPGPRA
jgi:two-component system nitrate/nitrite response regulator NarL